PASWQSAIGNRQSAINDLSFPRDPRHLHLVLRQGTGLVGANDRGGADRLTGDQLPDQAVGASHFSHGQSQGHGNAHRQPLRHGHHNNDYHVHEITQQETRARVQARLGQTYFTDRNPSDEESQENGARGHVADLADYVGQALQFFLEGSQLLGNSQF